MSRLVILDSEAVSALSSPQHAKAATVLAHLKVAATRRRKGMPLGVVVPTSVRVEAGWDRTAPSWSFANSLRIADQPLDTGAADCAAGMSARLQVSVADAHLGATIAAAPVGDVVTVLTSDPQDLSAVSGGRRVNVVAL